MRTPEPRDCVPDAAGKRIVFGCDRIGLLAQSSSGGVCSSGLLSAVETDRRLVLGVRGGLVELAVVITRSGLRRWMRSSTRLLGDGRLGKPGGGGVAATGVVMSVGCGEGDGKSCLTGGFDGVCSVASLDCGVLVNAVIDTVLLASVSNTQDSGSGSVLVGD